MMIPFAVVPSIEVGGLVGLWLHSDRPVERKVADTLTRLTSCPSRDWKRRRTSPKKKRFVSS